MAALYAISQEVGTAIDEAPGATALAETMRRVLGATGVEVTLAPHDDRPATLLHAGERQGAPDHVAPIAGGGQRWGELRVWGLPAPHAADSETAAFITALVSQLAVAAERAHIAAVTLQTQAIHEADRLKSALLSSVSHDLRTPLAAIKGAASNLLDPSMSWDAATQRLFAETIVAEADRLNRFMRNLLEMSRLEAGTVRRQRAAIEIGDVIVPTVQRLRSLLAEHPIQVEITPDLAPALINALQIELVLTNLLENAAKFAPAGTPITVSARPIEGAVQVSVADRGPGVPADALDRIFDKFYRVAAPERGPGGSGLGLAICQGIVAAHGGRIWVENRPGGGAILSFTLPVAPAELAAPIDALETTGQV
jgi:two-component system sensor histidine kinase KdpD